MNLLENTPDSPNEAPLRFVQPNAADDSPMVYLVTVMSSTAIPIHPERQLTLFHELASPILLALKERTEQTAAHINVILSDTFRAGEAPEADFKMDPNQLVSVRSRKKRELEMLWLADHKKELANYQGQWIGLEGYSLIAHGTDLSEVIRQLKDAGVSIPFTVFVPEEREGLFMGL
jgi:hypothetical protein